MKNNSNNNQADSTNQENQSPTKRHRILNIKQVFLKRLEFKTHANPLDSSGLSNQSGININISHEKRSEKEYLISLAIELESFDDDEKRKKNFNLLVEVFGLFEIDHFEEEEKNAFFYGFCANTLFPYVRNHISQVLSSSGFKPILLNPINFEQLYLEKIRERQATQTKPPSQQTKVSSTSASSLDKKSGKKPDPHNSKVH